MRLKKVDIITLTCFFFYYCTTKKNYIALIFMRVFVWSLISCNSVLSKSKILDFISISLKKQSFEFWESKLLKYRKFNISVLQSVQLYVFWCVFFFVALCFALLFALLHSKSLKTFAISWPKIVKHDVIRCDFLTTFLKNLSEILIGVVKLMSNTVLKVLRRYLPSFLSYEENVRGGG